ncbi:MAG: RNA-binding protein [Chloroflexi bacterium]|nr:RNA-binding protein [Chloroflexota bacterium]
MGKKLYVGNLSYSTTEGSLTELFEGIGEVASVNIIMDRATGRSKGFAFVEMVSESDVREAIDQLNGQSLDGRTIRVDEARPQERRESAYGGGGGGNRQRSRY